MHSFCCAWGGKAGAALHLLILFEKGCGIE